MRLVLGRSSLRFYARHPWQLALALAGIGLGVAVFVGVQLANDSARRAFELSTDALKGETTHRLLPIGGQLSESEYRALVLKGFGSRAAPVIETQVMVEAPSGEKRFATLLGIDPVEEVGFRSYSSFVPGEDSDVVRLLTVANGIMIPASMATDLGLEPDAEVDIVADGTRRSARVVGTTVGSGANVASAPPIIADIASAQDLLGLGGKLSRIDLSLSAEEARTLGASASPGTILVPAGSDNALEQMTRAFTTNLTALGLLALVVGMFLIYATISFAIVQRRRSMAILRTIGLTRRQLLASVLVEAAAIGVVGTLAGLMLGELLASGLVELVLRTMDDLYFRRALSAATPSSWIYWQGFAIGAGTTLVSALVPALEAARSDPAAAERRSTLERATRTASRRAAWLSLPCLAVAGALLVADEQSLILAFTSLFLVLVAGALVIPAGTALLMRSLERASAGRIGLPGRMALRGVTASLSRTGIATAALAVAVATVMSIGLMISSFRASLIDWLDLSLTADLYVSIDAQGTQAPPLTGEIDAIESLPGVESLSLSRLARIPTSDGELGLRAAEPGPDGWGIDVIAADEADPSVSLVGRDAVLVAEPHAFRFGIEPGDTVDLPTAAGPEPFEVAGVYRDYNATGAAFTLALDTYRRHWDDMSISGLGVHLDAGADTDAVSRQIRALLPAEARVQIRSTEIIERISLLVFDRTFQVTEVLRLLAGLVAFLGVLSAILAIQLEREREFAVLRSIGMSARDLARQVMTQTGLLGFAAGLAALPLGCILAWLLVYVINKRSFGWSMEFTIAATPLFQGLALALGAALLAGIYPARLGARVDLNVALRDE